MTEFEEQVAAILKALRDEWRPPNDRKQPDLMNWLAPRVAAAIEASEPRVAWRQASLRALRGAWVERGGAP